MTLYIMERFGYKLYELKEESAELLGLLELERLGTPVGGEDE